MNLNNFFQNLITDTDLPLEVRNNLKTCLDRNDLHSAKDAVFIYSDIAKKEGKNIFTMVQKTAIFMADTKLCKILAN